MKRTTKERIKRMAKGSVSIFLAFLMTGILSLSALLVEAGRYQEAKQLLEESTINSALSVLASYDSSLEGRFGLYGIDSTSAAADMFLNYLLFNLDAEESGEYSANNISKLYDAASGSYELKYDLANYQVLKRQILEYEKYRTPMNAALEMLDIDGMIKKLKENIEKLIPGLEDLLKVLDSIADIAEAIKALYCLYKDVQQLQLTINSKGEEDIGDFVNNKLGEAWNAVEGLFSDEEWPSHDPSYVTAYNAFKTAVNNKVNYMRSTPPPPNPGPKPTANVNSLNTQYQNAKNTYETADLVLCLLETADEIGFCNSKGIVDPSKNIEELLNEQFSKEQLQKFGLTEKSTRSEFFDSMNNEISSILGSSAMFSAFKSSEMKTVLSSLEAKVSSLQKDMQQKYSAYSKADSELSAWTKKNQAFTDYNNKMASYNTEINTKKASLLEVIGVVSGELSSYKGSLTNLSSLLDKATAAVKQINEVNKGSHTISEEDESDIFAFIKAELIIPEERKPEKGIAFLNDQRSKLNSLSAESITASYNFESEFNTGDLLGESSYYMTKTQATGYYAKIEGINILEKQTDIIDILEAIKKLGKILWPLPCTYNFNCVVQLNSFTTDILPSRINGGAGSFEDPDMNDIDAVSAMLDEARKMLSGYINDINNVDPGIRLSESELTAELSNRITRLSNNLTGLSTNDTMLGLIGNSNWPLISTVFKLIAIASKLTEIIDDLIFIAQHIEEAFNMILSSLGENFLLNQYITDKFPNRVSDKKGCTCQPRMFFPDNTQKLQTFSGAQVEYIIGGSYNEADNQRNAFWSIFAIRVLNNIVAVLGDPTARELIGACSIAAPLVLILWVYLESNIDMNMLISGMEVPLIKYEIVLSPNTFMENIEHICNAFEDIDEEKAKEQEMSYAAMKIEYTTDQLFDVDGMFKMKYENYLWLFLFFLPNQTKVMRTADLIQMEMRYKKASSGTDFELKNFHTYVRCKAEGAFNSILPIISLGNNTLNGRGIKFDCVKYIGY